MAARAFQTMFAVVYWTCRGDIKVADWNFLGHQEVHFCAIKATWRKEIYTYFWFDGPGFIDWALSWPKGCMFAWFWIGLAARNIAVHANYCGNATANSWGGEQNTYITCGFSCWSCFFLRLPGIERVPAFFRAYCSWWFQNPLMI